MLNLLAKMTGRLYLYIWISSFVFIAVATISYINIYWRAQSSTRRSPVGDAPVTNWNAQCKETLLTLYTTTDDVDHRRNVHENTVKNWAEFIPCVQPILFIQNASSEPRKSSSLADFALTKGWIILSYNRTINGLPIMKDMHHIVNRSVSYSTFIGYSNADILYDDGLVSTLKAVRHRVPNPDNVTLFVSGTRQNIAQKVFKTHAESLWRLENVQKVAREFGVMARSDSADIFIFARSGFPWDRVPDVVPGLPRYDSYFLGVATQWVNFNLDFTNTVVSLHQPPSSKGKMPARTNPHFSKSLNMDLIGTKQYHALCFRGRLCKHECANFVSNYIHDNPLGDNTSTHVVIEEVPRDKFCKGSLYHEQESTKISNII